MLTRLSNGNSRIGTSRLTAICLNFKMHCLYFLKFHFKVSDGKLSVEKSVEFMSRMAHGNSELVKIVREISENCSTISDPDR